MKEDILNQFLLSVSGNPKILASHISLFNAILSFKQKDKRICNVSRSKLMALSKLASTATYHKCLKDLIEFEFIEYRPTYHPNCGSVIKINL